MPDERAKLSQRNKYWIPEHRRMELIHFCRQYDDWKKEIRRLRREETTHAVDYKRQRDCRGMDKVMEVVKSMPTIEVPQWIPCSERLPEVGTYVLISKKALGFRSNLPSVCTAHRTHDPRSGKEEWNDMLFGKLNDDDVLAWMSLPEPYEER